MIDAEVDRLAKYLGTQNQDVKRLLAHASRGKTGADIARSVLRAMIRRTGANPDDLSLFPLVLDLPPGEMRIGRVINGTSEGPVLALPAGSSTDIQHVGIFGPTRSGKTYLMLNSTRQYIEAGERCWIIDPEDEYSVLVAAVSESRKPIPIRPEHLRVNFFQPPSDAVGWKVWLEDICLVMRRQLYLRDGSLNLFAASMNSLLRKKGALQGSDQYPSLAETLSRFTDLRVGGLNSRAGTWLESLVNRLTMLNDAFEHTAHVTSSDMLQQLAEHSVIFRLRSMRGLQLQFLADYLLTWLCRYREVAP